MTTRHLTRLPVVKTGMLIRRPVADVFEAFVDPALTAQFWFTRSTGRLEPGHQVTWHWEMYNVSAPVSVKAVEPHRRIVIEWPDQAGPTTVEFTFTPHPHGTFVSITNTGFAGDADTLLHQATDSTQGFTLVLAGAKAFLEHNIKLNLVADRYPPGVEA